MKLGRPRRIAWMQRGAKHAPNDPARAAAVDEAVRTKKGISVTAQPTSVLS